MSNVINHDLLVFEMAGSEFAMKLNIVDEVIPSPLITPIPDAAHFLMGLAGVRGKVISVINGAARYGISPALCSHLVVCNVRDNITAIAIDRPVLAGTMTLKVLSTEDRMQMIKKSGVGEKFFRDAYELMEQREDKTLQSTGRKFLEVDADLFVSTEMASSVGEA